MEYPNLDQFFKLHLHYEQHWKKRVGLSDAKWQTLDADTYLGNCEYAAGSVFKIFETSNFGWIVFRLGTKTPSGHTVGQRIIKY